MTDAHEARVTRFNKLFETHYEAVRAYARRRSPGGGDDIAAETFTVAWRRLDDVPELALPWLYAVARNVLCNAGRSERQRSAAEEEGAGDAVAPSFTEALEEGSVMRTALGRLSTADQEILLLVAWERLSGAALGAAVGCSSTAAAVRLFRARRRLAAALADAEAPASVCLTGTGGRLLDEN